MNDTKDRSTVRLGHHVLVGALAAAATVGATSAVATTDMFLKIGDIKGESSDNTHRNEIDVLAWSWGVNGPTAGDTKKTGTAACAQPLSIDKYVDKATPPLTASAVLNTTIPTARLTLRKAGGNPLEFLVVDLTGVTVKVVSNGGAAIDDRMKETVTLGFTSATISYTPQKPDGSADAAVVASSPGSCP